MTDLGELEDQHGRHRADDDPGEDGAFDRGARAGKSVYVVAFGDVHLEGGAVDRILRAQHRRRRQQKRDAGGAGDAEGDRSERREHYLDAFAEDDDVTGGEAGVEVVGEHAGDEQGGGVDRRHEEHVERLPVEERTVQVDVQRRQRAEERRIEGGTEIGGCDGGERSIDRLGRHENTPLYFAPGRNAPDIHIK